MGIMDRALVQAIAHQLTTDTPVSSMRDQMFFQGELFTHTLELYSRLFADDETEALVAINCTATTHADGCELLDSVSPAELHAFIARGHLSDDCYEAGMTSWRTS